MSTRRHDGARRDFKFVQIARAVRQKVSPQIDVSSSRIVELHEVLVVSTHAKGVVAA